ncbi:MAG: AbrB/MazE/SpoVT family DNA-binding domain-containing protein [Gemmatimonadota bacterium]
MKAKIVRIGNSRGVRIPKSLLEQTGLSDDVELEVRAGEIVIRSAKVTRAGWADSFQSMAETGDDALLDPESVGVEWDEDEWTW